MRKVSRAVWVAVAALVVVSALGTAIVKTAPIQRFQYVFAEGIATNSVHPWVVIANPTPYTMQVELRLKRANGTPAGWPFILWNHTVPAYGRESIQLDGAAAGSNFWLVVTVDRPGAVTLSTWSPNYAFPPLVVPYEVYEIWE